MRVRKYFRKDARGRWWYQPPKGTRKRARVRWCPICRTRFLSANPRIKTCSHTCGAKAMHQDRPITTVGVLRTDIKGVDNPRYSLDEKGQWWYKPIGTKEHGRTRASIITCKRCSQKFLTSVFHRRNAEYCSHTCSTKAACEANPGRYKGEKGGNWKGGRRIDNRGYVLIWKPDHPTRRGKIKPYMQEHRFVMESVLGRILEPHERVHHKNGIKHDNRPENLEMWTNGHPSGQRLKESPHCPTCTCSKQS